MAAKAYIFVNGDHELAPRTLHDDGPGPQDFVVCADGGALLAHRLGVRPHLIVGDLDSIEPALLGSFEESGVEVRRHPSQKNESDLELSVGQALAAGAEEIVFVGGFGGRLDHLLVNVFLMAEVATSGVRSTLLGRGTTVRFLSGPESVTFAGKKGDVLSIVPFATSTRGVTTEGLKWPLEEATLRFGSTLTLSNEFVAAEARVKVGEGRLAAIHVAAAK